MTHVCVDFGVGWYNYKQTFVHNITQSHTYNCSHKDTYRQTYRHCRKPWSVSLRPLSNQFCGAEITPKRAIQGAPI